MLKLKLRLSLLPVMAALLTSSACAPRITPEVPAPPPAPKHLEVRQGPYTFRPEWTQPITRETFLIGEFPAATKSLRPPARGLAIRFNPQTAPPAACTMPIVRFGLASATLEPAAGEALLAGLRNCRITGSRLSVTGYTCDLGPAAVNAGLALRRAANVAEFLTRHGYVVGEVRGGKATALSPEKRHLARRVEITRAP